MAIGPDKWDLRFLDMAYLIASWSKDPSTQHGAVVVEDRRVLGLGFNGFPPRVADSKERLENRELKYQLVVHAEVNALLNCTTKSDNATMYVDAIPCVRCMVTVLANQMVKVRRLVVVEPTPDYLSRWGESVKLTKGVIDEAGIEFLEVPLHYLLSLPHFGEERE